MAEPAVKTPAPAGTSPEIEWLISRGLVPYEIAVRRMEARVATIAAGEATECVWLLEHPPIYTGGTSADPAELIDPHRFPVFRTGRGGRFTYHGPGQRVAYVMLNLATREQDVRAYVRALEDWLIAALAQLGIDGERHEEQVGIFTGGAKIASIGVRVRRWVTFHGVSLNVSPDLDHFSGIVPCGLHTPVTSLETLGAETDMERVDTVLRASFTARFNASAAP
jgi:lipoyl(octanoyl) transferase